MPLFPESDPVQANLIREIQALRREIKALQTKPEPDPDPSVATKEAVFSYPGLVTQGIASGRYVNKMLDGAIQRIDVTSTSPSSDVLDVLINGDVAYQITLDNDLVVEDGLYLSLDELDYIQVVISDLNGSLSDVVVTIEVTDAGV